MRRTAVSIATALLLALAVSPLAAAEAEKAPMPQTKGMQGMDPAAHERWEKEGAQDPHKDCVPDAKAAAHQAAHPMPQTKGMQGMDAKAHTVKCPEAKPEKSDKPRHVHKQ